MKTKISRWIFDLVLAIIITFSCGFIAFMGYMNFRTNYQDIENQILQEVSSDSVTHIQTSLQFGKTFENYYGMNELFDSYKSRVQGNVEIFVLNKEDILVYQSFEKGSDLYSVILGQIGDKDFTSLKETVAGQKESGFCKVGGRNYVLNPICQDKEYIGCFVVTYPEAFIDSQLTGVKEQVVGQTLIAIALLLMIYAICRLVIAKMVKEISLREKLKRNFPIVLIVIAIIIQSSASLVVYQNSYKESMLAGANLILQNLDDTVSKVVDEGVELQNVEGLEQYLHEKVSNVPILWNIKISDEIANAAKSSGRESSLLMQFNIDGKSMMLEAELSNEYINNQLLQIILVLISTLIIMIIFIIEIMKLPKLIMYRVSKNANQESEESYLQVSDSLRITGFFCSTAEYICLPYAAMMIRDMNESLFGLSVGMTAALPLSLEGFAQMIAMLVLPKFVKKMDIKKTLVISSFMMAVCNILAFQADGALQIVLFRGLAGIAYAGFKQVSNYLITRGYKTDLQRSRNLSQDNAGLLGGVTCGAGLGAIICSTSGYALTFFVSAGVFIVYFFIAISVVPWKWLKGKQKDEEDVQKLGIKKVLRMIFSFEMLRYIFLIGIPLNIGVLLCVTLIPGICQSQGISTVILSYCYIANGIAGIYIGPNLVNFGKRIFGLKGSIAIAFGLTGFSLFILKLPMVIVMMIAASMILGFLDGFATPLAMDDFIEMKVVKKAVNESTALIFCVVLSYVLITVAPMIAELMLIETSFVLSPLMIAAILYCAVALLLVIRRGREKNPIYRNKSNA